MKGSITVTDNIGRMHLYEDQDGTVVVFPRQKPGEYLEGSGSRISRNDFEKLIKWGQEWLDDNPKSKLIYYGKSATSYDLQIGKVVFRYVFLKGGHWTHPFQPSRFSVKYYPDEEDQS